MNRVQTFDDVLVYSAKVLLSLLLMKHAITIMTGVDLTLVIGGILLILSVIIFLQTGFSKARLAVLMNAALFSLVAYAFLSVLFHGPSDQNLLVDLIFILIMFNLGTRIPSETAFNLPVIIMLGLAECYLVVTDRGYVYASGLNYLNISQPLLIMLIAVLFSRGNSTVRRVGRVIGTAIFMVAHISVQARFNFLLGLGLIALRYRRYALIAMVLLAAAFALNLVQIDWVALENMPLFRRLLFGFADDGRYDIMDAYWNEFSTFFVMGKGLGGTPDLFIHLRDAYPHNFLLELISEFGFIGFVTAAVFLLVAAHVFQRHSKQLMFFEMILFAVIVVIFLKSFSFYDSYFIWYLLGFLIKMMPGREPQQMAKAAA